MKRKYFEFMVQARILDDEKIQGLLPRMLTGIVVLRAEHDWVSNTICYNAWHEEAPEVEEGRKLPHAYLECSDLKDRFYWRWKIGDFEFGKGFVLKEHLKRVA